MQATRSPGGAGAQLEQQRGGGDEVRELLDRLGDQPAGQVLPVGNQVYRPRYKG